MRTAHYSSFSIEKCIVELPCRTPISFLRVCRISGKTRMLPDSSLSGNIWNYRVSSCRIRIIPNIHVNIVLLNHCLERKSSINQLLDTAVTSPVTCEWPCSTKYAFSWQSKGTATMCKWMRGENSFNWRLQRTPAHTSTCLPLHPVLRRQITHCSNLTCVHAGIVYRRTHSVWY